jgi:hypothetical protein
MTRFPEMPDYHKQTAPSRDDLPRPEMVLGEIDRSEWRDPFMPAKPDSFIAAPFVMDR